MDTLYYANTTAFPEGVRLIQVSLYQKKTEILFQCRTVRSKTKTIYIQYKLIILILQCVFTQFTTILVTSYSHCTNFKIECILYITLFMDCAESKALVHLNECQFLLWPKNFCQDWHFPGTRQHVQFTMNSWSDSKIFKFFDTCMTVHRVFGYHLRQLRKHDWRLSMRHADLVEHDSFQSLSIARKNSSSLGKWLSWFVHSVMWNTWQCSLSWMEKVMATNSPINSKIPLFFVIMLRNAFIDDLNQVNIRFSTSYQYQPIPRTALTRYVRCYSEAGIPMISWCSCGEDIYFYLMTSGL